jgi:integral membrane protein
MFTSSVGILRFVGIVEGISYLVLLAIAMPLKYLLDFHMAVTIIGGLHGFLFVLFAAMVVIVKFKKRWSILWGIWAFFSSIIPFGTFYLDKQLKTKE